MNPNRRLAGAAASAGYVPTEECAELPGVGR